MAQLKESDTRMYCRGVRLTKWKGWTWVERKVAQKGGGERAHQRPSCPDVAGDTLYSASRTAKTRVEGKV
jgi:hypothetical protein